MTHSTLILGTRKGLIILKYDGHRWQRKVEAFPGVPLSYAVRDQRTDTIWVAADHGHWGQKLYKSLDEGETLTEVPGPKYPEGTTKWDVWQDPPAESPAAVTYIWTIVPGADDQPERLYIGTEPGAVFQSDDGGQSFTLNEAFWNHPSRPQNWFGGGRDQAGSCSIVVDPRDRDHLYVGVSVGGVFESTDGGKTWAGRNKGLIAEYLPDPHAEYGHDPHYLTLSPSHPDVLWQQNHCGVFRSTNGGRSWDDISSPDQGIKFGFPIVVHPQNPNTAWVIPAKSDDMRMAIDGALFVARTSDGGETWEELRSGLPQENCYDVVFRHAFHSQGDLLAFGSTTGNLYISSNGGDHWELISGNLPPIYSVRFA